MQTLSTLESVVDLRDHKEDLEMMTATNFSQEKRRRGQRSEDVVRRHTAMGLGAEIALTQTGLFESYSKITEGAVGLSYVQRKRDLKCEDFTLEVKVMSGKYNRWYISDAQCESVLRSAVLNDFFLIVEYEDLGSLKYRYRPRFLIDSKRVSEYIIKGTGGYSSFMFSHERAIKRSHCIDLGEYTHA